MAEATGSLKMSRLSFSLFQFGLLATIFFIKINDIFAASNTPLETINLLSAQIEKHLSEESLLSTQKQEIDLGIANLAEELKDIESDLKERKKELSFKLRYITGSSTSDFLRNLFQSKNAGELEKNFRFLTIIINQDFKLIKSIQEKSNEFSNKKEMLIQRFSKISELEKKLKKEEIALKKQLALKNKILEKIKRTQLKTFVDLRGYLKWPTEGNVTQSFGILKDQVTRVHLPFQGVFIETTIPSPVKSVAKGIVAYIYQTSKHNDATVIIEHSGAYHTLYGSLTDLKINLGQQVDEGQIIGQTSARSFLYTFKPGLYFELREGLVAKDPQKWLTAKQLNKTQNENWENIQ